MAENNISASVGKKIVEALKMQSGEIVSNEAPVSVSEELNAADEVNETNVSQSSAFTDDDGFEDATVFDEQASFSQNLSFVNSQPLPEQPQLQNVEPVFHQNFIDNTFQQVLSQNISSASYGQIAFPEDIDVPQNVAILTQLISKLPSGVSKKTGALIIRQTMEALGISMQTVLQEARMVQDTLNAKVNECHATIMDCKRQISSLEMQSQQCNKQSMLLSDVISLFING